MAFKIIFEDSDILVLDKPSGLVVNRSVTTKDETLQDQLSDYFHLGSDLGIGERAGIVHRLDRESSGVLIVAKHQKTFDYLQEEFKNRRVEKEYTALVHGLMTDQSGSIEGKIGRIGKFGKFGIIEGGRESKTDWYVDKRLKIKDKNFNELVSSFTKGRINYLKNHSREYCLLRLFPKTGRTHQVRVHLKSIGHPIVSDAIYGPRKLLKFDFLWCLRLYLHAFALAFNHPSSQKRVRFVANLPKDLKSAILNLSEI